MNMKLLPKRNKPKVQKVISRKNRRFTDDGKKEYILGFKIPVKFINTYRKRGFLFSTVGSISLMVLSLVFFIPWLSIDIQYWLRTPFPTDQVSVVQVTRWGFPFDYLHIMNPITSNITIYSIDIVALILSFLFFFLICYLIYKLFSSTGFGSVRSKKGRRSIMAIALLLFVAITPMVLAVTWTEDPIAQMTVGREGWGISIGTDPNHSALFEQTLKPSISSVYMMGLYMSKDSGFPDCMFRVAFHSQSIPNLIVVEFNTSTIGSSSSWNDFSTSNQWVHVTPGNVYMITLSPLPISQPHTPMGEFLYWWGSDASGPSDDKYTDGQNMIWLGDHWYTANDCVPPDTGFQYEDFMFKIFTSGGGGGGDTIPTISLTANPLVIVTGNSSTLSWTSTNATSIQIDNGIGSVATPSGTRSVSPTSTTTYIATATSSTGTTRQSSVTVTVNSAPIPHPPNVPITPIGGPVGNGTIGTSYSFSSVTQDPDGDHIQYKFDWGDGISTDWSILYESGTVVTNSHSWNRVGTFSVKVMAKDSTGLPSDYSAPKNIVIVENVSHVPVITKFLVSPDHILYGASFTIEYQVQCDTSITVNIDHDVYSGHAFTGSFSIIGNTTSIYLITVTSSTGSTTTASDSISVDQPVKPTVSIESSRTSVDIGEYVTITWSSVGATSVTIDNGVTTNGATSGSVNVQIQNPVTFIVTAIGPGGTVTASVAINGGNGGGGGIPWLYVIIILIMAFIIINLVYYQKKGEWIHYGYYGASIWSWIKNTDPPEKPKSKNKSTDKSNRLAKNEEKAYFDYVIQYGDKNAEVNVKNQRRTKRKKNNMKKRGKK